MNLPEIELVIDAGLSLLPMEMDTKPARAMLVAIGYQESKFQHRRQMGNGPARGWWQFEQSGVSGVWRHPKVGEIARDCAHRLGYADPGEVYHAIEHNDLLAVVFARMNLRWLPWALPADGDDEDGWRQYLAAWRPGKPHPQTWPAHYAKAWASIA